MSCVTYITLKTHKLKAYVLENNTKTFDFTQPVHGSDNLLKSSRFELLVVKMNHPLTLFLRMPIKRIVRSKTYGHFLTV